jgi:hypothetical protein
VPQYWVPPVSLATFCDVMWQKRHTHKTPALKAGGDIYFVSIINFVVF